MSPGQVILAALWLAVDGLIFGVSAVFDMLGLAVEPFWRGPENS